MDFDKIRLKGSATVELKLRGAKPSDSYSIKDVDGLEASLGNSISASKNGTAFYRGRNPEPMVLTFTLGLNPKYRLGETAESLRKSLRSLISPGLTDDLTIEFVKDNVVVGTIKGYVDSFVPGLFDKKPAVVTVIKCSTAYIVGPSLIDAAYDISTTSVNGRFSVENIGDLVAGLEISFRVSAAGGSVGWSLYNFAPGSNMTYQTFELTTFFQFGDVVVVNTTPRNKYVKIVRNGIEINKLGDVADNSTWIMLHGGVNYFGTADDFKGSDPKSPYELLYFRYVPLYLGV